MQPSLHEPCFKMPRNGVGWEVGEFYDICISYLVMQHTIHVKAADIWWYPLSISSHHFMCAWATCIAPCTTWQSMRLLLQHKSVISTLRALSEGITYQPNKSPELQLSSSHLKIHMGRGRKEVTRQQAQSTRAPEGSKINWCFARIDGLSQGNEGAGEPCCIVVNPITAP